LALGLNPTRVKTAKPWAVVGFKFAKPGYGTVALTVAELEAVRARSASRRQRE
jgi:hypothetical protein